MPTRRGSTLEVHREAGPPRLTIVVHGGQRVCELEVATDRGSGVIRHVDRWQLSVAHPPASGEWWLLDADGAARCTVTRTTPFGERFHIQIEGAEFHVVPMGRWWRRRWWVCDAEERTVLEVRQRLFTRPIHDLAIRSGDLPADLCWVVAWLIAERTTRELAATRRPRYWVPGV